ncbi:Methyltransferase type 11 [Haliangium ochraceum DSM 14365]|uniref:Methyltransferase type 11 n=1 Tax=Haliangium ochraceum (strain DSM 14365 / JCM 11303 / SMP-2) TaxID=502025 RepID=D0LMM9_HALO1|nr:Methyltransferase type 11 [Haliangium ochraceum DSM 14365]
MVSERAGEVVEGILLCSEPACQCEYPIIDGIPLITADIRTHVSNQLGAMQARSDISPVLASLLGDCAGPDSEFVRTRYQLSSYARSHYGDLDPDEPGDAEGGLGAVVTAALELLEQPPTGAWLDTGCSVGRASFELAARTGELVLGVDLNLAMLRIARHLAHTGEVVHPLRRQGIVYEQRRFAVDFAGRERVDFWACDVMALPFAEASLDGALSVNVADCLPSPLMHLMELGRVLRPEACALLTTPYDWSENVTPIAGWIGGHSQRGPARGDCPGEMRRVLSEAMPADYDTRLRVFAEREAVPWHVYVHARATMRYQLHALAARRT